MSALLCEYPYASGNRVRTRLNWQKLASVAACYDTVTDVG